MYSVTNIFPKLLLRKFSLPSKKHFGLPCGSFYPYFFINLESSCLYFLCWELHRSPKTLASRTFSSLHFYCHAHFCPQHFYFFINFFPLFYIYFIIFPPSVYQSVTPMHWIRFLNMKTLTSLWNPNLHIKGEGNSKGNLL